jgi:hypothetical protein
MKSRKEQEVLQSVISRAWEDQVFRKKLIDDPVKTIEDLTEVKVVLPEGKTLIVVDQSDNSKFYINIPVEPDLESIELNEQQLETIAGGEQNIMGDIVNNLFSNFKNFIKYQ